MTFAYGPLTLYGRLSQVFLLTIASPQLSPQPQSNCFNWFGLFRVRSPLLTESLLMSFPGPTQMFQFRPFPTHPYLIQDTLTGDEPAGLPHSEISGSMLICSSPKLIAACHVFHRLLMPRHSPCTLYSLTFCLVTFWFSNKKFLELCRLLRGINCSLFYPSLT